MKLLATFIPLSYLLAASAYAHPGIMPHPETASETSHFLIHAVMALPVVIGAWLLAVGVKKRLRAQRTTSHKRD